jgi:hypothetical protein
VNCPLFSRLKKLFYTQKFKIHIFIILAAQKVMAIDISHHPLATPLQNILPLPNIMPLPNITL